MSSPLPPPSAEIPELAPRVAGPAWKNWAGAGLGLVILGLAVWGVSLIAREVTLAQVLGAIRATPTHLFIAAALSAALSYVFLIGYDWFATRHLGYRIGWPTMAAASFSSFTISHTLGLSAVTGGGVRYRFYSRAGMKPGDIAVMIVLCGWTFYLGVTTVAGLGLLFSPDLADSFAALVGELGADPRLVGMERIIGGLLIGIVVLWVAAAALWRRPMRLFGYRFFLPDGGSAFVQIIIGMIDLAFAGGALYLLLPETGTPMLTSVLAIYGVAMLSGAILHAPGGLGVFEGVVLLLLPDAPKADVLAALVMFRVCYTYVPFLLGVLVLLLGEARGVRRPAAAEPRPATSA